MRQKNFVKELFDGHSASCKLFDHHILRKAKKVIIRGDLEDFDDTCTKASYVKKSKGWWWDDKEQNVRWNLVYTYLQSRVGEPWDKVYSDIKKLASEASKENSRFLIRAVDGYVTKNVYFDKDSGGKPKALRNSYNTDVYGLYVDPETGLLRETKRVSYRTLLKQRNAEELVEWNKTARKVNDTTYLLKEKDTWFIVKVTNIDERGKALAYYLYGIDRYEQYKKFRAHVIEVPGSRRTLSAKEKKQYGV